MRIYFLLIAICPLFAGCFTISTIDKAKWDRRSETADSILTSYKDDKGYTTIIYTRQATRHIYKLSQPVDSIIAGYRKSKALELINSNQENDFKGVFYVANVNKEKGYQRVLLFDKETRIKDTSGLMQEIISNTNIAKVLNQKLYMPVGRIDSPNAFPRIYTRSISFILNSDFDDSAITRKEMYLIVLQPQRRKYTRYLLLPLTVGLDVITLPFQLVVFGAIWGYGKVTGQKSKPRPR